ncbi:Sua5/YciO/YrdC/YwlC family protein [Candidatus Daviesbacteria bacterium]|nr:Sua5/YciO/YrdC/YwlC family protein [Candidatus Daviesbacteria bacterium]
MVRIKLAVRQTKLIKLPGSDLIKQILEYVQVERLRPQVKKAALKARKGEIILIPADGVYNLSTNGTLPHAVETSRAIKQRTKAHREGMITPPKKLLRYIDLKTLKELNGIGFEVIDKLYKAGQIGLIIPCLEEVTPSHLITYHEINGKQIPTVLNVWNYKCKIWQLLDKEFSKDPNMLWVGTSANISNNPSITDFATAIETFGQMVSAAIKDPREHRHIYTGSYTVINLAKKIPEVHRIGSIDPNKHPEKFNKLVKVLASSKINLVIPSDTKKTN